MHAYLWSSHAVQDDGFNDDFESWEDIEIEQAVYREPAVDFLEGVLAGTVSVGNEGVTTAIIAAAVITAALAGCWQVAAAVGHLDRPVHNDVQEGKDLGDDMEQAEVDAATTISSLLRGRHEAEQSRLPACVVFIDVGPVHVSDRP